MVRAKMGAAVGLVIAVDAGDYGIAQAHAGDCFRDAVWFFFIWRANRSARGDGAEAAGASTDIAENHEGGRTVFPAFTHVGTAGGFANGMEVERAHDPLEVLVTVAAEEFNAEPVWARMGGGRWRGDDWAVVGDDVERRGHGGSEGSFYLL